MSLCLVNTIKPSQTDVLEMNVTVCCRRHLMHIHGMRVRCVRCVGLVKVYGCQSGLTAHCGCSMHTHTITCKMLMLSLTLASCSVIAFSSFHSVSKPQYPAVTFQKYFKHLITLPLLRNIYIKVCYLAIFHICNWQMGIFLFILLEGLRLRLQYRMIALTLLIGQPAC